MIKNIEKIYKISELKKLFNIECLQIINEERKYSEEHNSLNAISNLKKQCDIEKKYNLKFCEILDGEDFFSLCFKPKNTHVYFPNAGVRTENIQDNQVKCFFNMATYLQNKGFFVHMESANILDFKLLIVTDDIEKERKEVERLLAIGNFDDVLIDKVCHLCHLC